MLISDQGRVAEVAGEHGWHPPKSLDSDINFKPEHTLFCGELKFVAIYALLKIFRQKKYLLGSKTVFLGQEVHYYTVYSAYFTDLDLQICDYAQKQCICRENCKCVLDKNFHGHFCPQRKAVKICHPAVTSAKCHYFACFTFCKQAFLAHNSLVDICNDCLDTLKCILT